MTTTAERIAELASHPVVAETTIATLVQEVETFWLLTYQLLLLIEGGQLVADASVTATERADIADLCETANLELKDAIAMRLPFVEPKKLLAAACAGGEV
ncbi:MAG: hypothetical protein QM599_03435 [Pseudoxanthomonas sp.]